jgi:hypothetical protein
MLQQNNLDIINEICSGGYTSARLDAYMGMRKLVMKQLGEQSVPIVTTFELKERMFRWFKQEVAKTYKSESSSARLLASLFFGQPITRDFPLGEMTRLVQEHPGTDFGIHDLDKLADLFCMAVGKRFSVVGNMLQFGEVGIAFYDSSNVQDMVRAIQCRGGSVSAQQLEGSVSHG